jgi:S1-C subfamily serine protease
MRLWDKIALVALVVFAILSKLAGDDSVDPGSGSARRPDPGQFVPVQPIQPSAPLSPDDAGIVVPVGDRQSSSSGTAFSVDSSGVWITARHVADGCDKIVLQRNSQQFVRVNRVQHHRNADISILWTQRGVPALPLLKHPLRPDQDGYSFGFPKGDPGDVYARLIGRTKMHQRGRYRTNEPVVAWTHVRRVPDRGAHLGGISGGPWVNAAGRILGVHVAGNPRRGRSYATAPSSLRAALVQAGLPDSGASKNLEQVLVTPRNFPSVGNQLRRTLTVAKVLCLVGDKWRNERRRR